MIDQSVRSLLEGVIDTPLKLQLALMFAERRCLYATAAQVADRIYRDIWSTREALRELAEGGVLSETMTKDGPAYAFCPSGELAEPIRRLVQCYNEPLERDLLYRTLREIAGDASYRRAVRMGIAFESMSF
ncbi:MULTISPECIES: hypothetical protein [Roseiflexus]|jgi:hypothetical protein|uniref:Uncharacterized protein n=1 Tax=Roseiflexus castenholzii (strain DSM 13941 / HLO8) TaxID=383372 RepID=A7NMU1_ROSCS|nr:MULTISPECIES: hypothetical protein [Roseiflexus]ABU58865.1 conserved hypothetical protein [Roseiflexus castenholzii DSM 13941]PMP81431.1 MAG: hypothetical protein C0183_12210 [Roseiflexus castenholzii]GIW01851.1 MAG: hypothetical protein KatS3mg058_3254 [Roseiflexus sp.]